MAFVKGETEAGLRRWFFGFVLVVMAEGMRLEGCVLRVRGVRSKVL